jgi:hypothetical protein
MTEQQQLDLFRKKLNKDIDNIIKENEEVETIKYFVVAVKDGKVKAKSKEFEDFKRAYNAVEAKAPKDAEIFVFEKKWISLPSFSLIAGINKKIPVSTKKLTIEEIAVLLKEPENVI